MRIFDLARRPPQWLRVALASLLLAFALNGVAHAAHEDHAVATSVAHSAACGYCASFGSLADVPRHGWSPPVIASVNLHVDPVTGVVLAFRPRSVSQPRAPPIP